MNIIEAAKSGYRFRRKNMSNWITSNKNQYGYLTAHLTSYDILAEDWEIDAPKKRYWKWVVKDPLGEIIVSSGYYDDRKKDPKGTSLHLLFSTIQKIESEYIDV